MTGEDDLDEGGDAVCWIDRVCPACGHLDDGPPPDRCLACGALLGEERRPDSIRREDPSR